MKKPKILVGTIVRVMRSHHNMNDHCVGKLGVIKKKIMKNIFFVKMNDGVWGFGTRDLKVITPYDMLDWTSSFSEVQELGGIK